MTKESIDVSQATVSVLENDIDPAAVRARYRKERDRRLNPKRTSNPGDTSVVLYGFNQDPYSEPFVREPLTDEVDAVIVGGGFGGLIAGAYLRRAGVDRIRIIEKGGDVGGTWYWNRYPGAQCDIESYVYMPMLEETNYIPTEKYAHGPEIFAHAKRIAEQYDLYRDACFQTSVTELRWLDDENKWLVLTDRGDRIKARYAVQTNSVLDRPKLPDVPGIDRFKGHMFHTSRWDYGYTGGDTNGGLEGLRDKRVAIIGTGATAVQVVPYVGKYAKQLLVFQRTPSSVDVRGNRPTDPDWAKSLQPGWQRRRQHNFVALTSGVPQDEDMVGDGWTEVIRNMGAFSSRDGGAIPSEKMAEIAELADMRKMNKIRARVDEIVQDRETAEALKPWFRQFCKRPCFHDEYLPTFNLPNVKLVDTDALGPDCFTENGIVACGIEYPVDCVIFATGFEFSTGGGDAYVRRLGHQIYGRNGLALSDKWKHGFRTLHGFMSHDFPNLFHMGPSQNGLAFAVTCILQEQGEHLGEIITEARLRQAHRIEPTAEAESDWVNTIREKSGAMRAFQQECTPGYYNNEGKVGGENLTFFDEIYGGGPIEFNEVVRRWRAEGMKGIDFR